MEETPETKNFSSSVATAVMEAITRGISASTPEPQTQEEAKEALKAIREARRLLAANIKKGSDVAGLAEAAGKTSEQLKTDTRALKDSSLRILDAVRQMNLSSSELSEFNGELNRSIKLFGDIVASNNETEITVKQAPNDPLIEKLSTFQRLVSQFSKNTGAGAYEGGTFKLQTDMMDVGILGSSETAKLSDNVMKSFRDIKNIETLTLNLISNSSKNMESSQARLSEIESRSSELSSREEVLNERKKNIEKIQVESGNQQDLARKEALLAKVAAEQQTISNEKRILLNEQQNLKSNLIETEKQKYAAIDTLKAIESSKDAQAAILQKVADKWIAGIREITKDFKDNLDYERTVIAMQASHSNDVSFGDSITSEFSTANKTFWVQASEDRKKSIQFERASIKSERADLIDSLDALLEKEKSGEYAEEAIEAERKALFSKMNALNEREIAISKAEQGSSAFGDAVMRALEPTIKTAQEIGSNADLRMSMFEDASKMSWFAAREELKIVREEEKILLANDKLAQAEYERMMEAIKAGAEVTEEDKKRIIQARKVARDALKDNKSRRKALEERESKGMLGNFLESINKTFQGLKDGFRKASTHWITKLIAALVLFGFMLKRGIITPSRVAKVVSLIVNFLVAALITVIKLLVVGLVGAVKSIFHMFASGNILAGVISLLILTITSLMVLATLINLATIGWGKVVGAVNTLSSAASKVSDGLKKIGIDAPKLMKNFGKNLTGGLKSVFGNLKGGLTKMFGGLQGSMKSLASDTSNTIKGKLGGALGKVGKVFGGKDRAASTLGGSVVSRVQPTSAASSLPRPSGAERTVGKSGGFLKGLADTLKQLGSNKAVKGALTLALLATSVLLISKAFMNFSKVSWSGVAVGLVSIYALIRMTKMLKDSNDDIVKGTVGMFILGAALNFIATALIKFNSVEWGSLIKAGIALIGFAYILEQIGDKKGKIIKGSIAAAIMGLALLPFAFTVQFLKGLSITSIIAFALGVYLLGEIVAKMGKMQTALYKGSIAVAILGFALLPIAFAIQFTRGLSILSVIAFALGVYLLAGIVALLGIPAVAILVSMGAGVIALLGVALLPIGLAMQAIKGVKIGALISFVEGLYIVAISVALLAPLTPLILLGSIAIGFLGLGLSSIVEPLSKVKGFDAGSIEILASAIWRLALSVVSIALLTPLIILGSFAILIMGIGLVTVVLALSNVKNFDAASIDTLIGALWSIAWQMVIFAFMSPFIILGSVAIFIMGLALNSVVNALAKVKKFDAKSIFVLIGALTILAYQMSIFAFMSPLIILGSVAIWIMGMALNSVVDALAKVKNFDAASIDTMIGALWKLAGQMLWFALISPAIVIGSVAIWIMGMALNSVIDALAKVKNFDAASIDVLAEGISKLAWAISGISIYLVGVLLGSIVLQLMAWGLGPIVDIFAKLSGIKVDMATIFTLAFMIYYLADVVSGLWYYVPWMIAGAYAASLLGDALATFVPIVEAISQGIDPASVLAFGFMVGTLVLAAAFAGYFYDQIVMGSIALSWLGIGVRNLVPVAQALKGLELESALIFGMLVGILVGIAAFAGYFYDQIVMGSIALAELGIGVRNLVPVAQALKGLELESILIFEQMVAVLVGIATFAGKHFDDIIMGSVALDELGLGVRNLIPVAKTLKGLELESALIFGMLVSILVGIATFAGYFYEQIIFGSIALDQLGKSITTFVPITKALKGVDAESALMFGIMTSILIGVALFAGFFYERILLGSMALEELGKSVSTFAPVVKALKGIEANSAIAFGILVEILVSTAIFAGYYYNEILNGSWALWHLGKSIETFVPFLKSLKGIDMGAALGFSLIMGILIGVAFLAWWMGGIISEGSMVIEKLGESLSKFAPLFNSLKGMSVEDAEALKQIMISLVDGALYAAKHVTDVLIGAGALMVLAEAFKEVNAELNFFTKTLDKLSKLADPLTKLSDSLINLSASIASFGGQISSMTDEEIEKIVKLSGSVSSEGETNSVSNTTSADGGGGIFAEIRDILLETKEIHMQQAGNNIVSMNQSSVSNNTSKQEAPIVKNVRARDSYFSRLSFKHHC